MTNFSRQKVLKFKISIIYSALSAEPD